MRHAHRLESERNELELPSSGSTSLHRLFVNTMRGSLYSISYDGKTVTRMSNADAWALRVQFDGHESGVRISTFQPQFNQRGTPGFGKFYTYTDTANITAKADRLPLGDGNHGSWFFVLRGHLPDRPWFIEKIPSLS